MKPEDAIVLDNMIPGVGDVSNRRGHASHAKGLLTYVESLMEYAGVDGTNKLFAATPTMIYDVTAPANYIFTITAGSATISATYVQTKYSFTITSGSATLGATYTNNSVTYTVGATVASATSVTMHTASASTTSGTELTKVSGTGDATLTFSARADTSVTYTVVATVSVSTEVIMSGASAPTSVGTLAKASGTGDSTLTFSAYDDNGVAAAIATGLTNGRWQHVMFGTSAGSFLVMVNGADAVKNYNGTSWTTPTITGSGLSSSANFIHVNVHGNRLWFVEKDKLSAWYLPVQSISGTATESALSSYCKKGGYLQVMGTWTRDGGSGSDDYAVFITSKGEVVIFSGADPASWTMVGVFPIAEPMGRRCLMKAGSDLAVLTIIGLMPLSQVLVANVSGQSLATVTNKIHGAFIESSYTGSGYHGWQAMEYPRGKLVLINVPQAERVSQYQYIANVETGSWARWTGMNAGCWSLLGRDLYFGGNSGVIYKYGDDYSDNGSTISSTIQQAYSNLGTNNTKRIVATRPLVRTPSGYSIAVDLKTDYDSGAVSLAGTTSTTGGSLWNVALWNESFWNGTSTPSATWQSVSGLGVVASVSLAVSVSQEFTLNQTDVMFEPGNYS